MAKGTEIRTQRQTSRDRIAIGSMIVMVMLVLFRAMSTHEPFPMWDSDPYLFGTPITGITAGFGILLNTIVMLLSLVVLFVVPSDGSRGGRWMRGLLGVGYGGLCVHMATDPGTVMDGSTLGAMIGATVASAVFIRAHPEWIRVLVPVVLGSGVVLAVYGAHQVFIQHPRTVDMYEANRVPFLEARGWAEGSFEAMTYERRLRQPEPSGWFGLSNVFASFMGALGVAMMMVTLCSLKRAWWIASGLIGGLLLAILLISKSKGGIGAAILGLATLQYALARHRGRGSRIGTSTLGVCVVVMLGVVGGAIVHQLSLLFRAQYMIGAIRIFAEHPILGVGPGRFQDAYMIQKPATSPEDVTSAHNLVFDLLAQLGIAGIAWIGVLVVLLWSARLPRRPTEVHSEANPSNEIGQRTLVRVILLMALFVGIAMIRVQTASLDLELMLILLGAVGLWIAVAVLLGVLGSVRALRLAMLGAAVVLVIHAMLDLTPVMIVSAPLFGVCVGFGFGPGKRVCRDQEDRSGWFSASSVIATLGMSVVIVLTGSASVGVINRDLGLIRIAAPAIECSQIRMLMESQVSMTDLAHRASVLTRTPVAEDAGSIMRSLDAFELEHRAQSASGLIELSSKHPDSKLLVTALEQSMKAVSMLDQHDRSGSGVLWDWIGKTADRLSIEADSFSELKWAGHAHILLSQRRGVSSDESMRLLVQSLDDWSHADALNPHDPVHAIRLMDLAIELGHQDVARHWAAKSLDRSGRMRLDPLKELGPAERLRAQDVIEGVISGHTRP